jgi:serine/threonine-protein phosphatase PP1 catalytic subunit
MKEYEKLIELPLKGKALIITDLHGNLEDYGRYMEIWKEFKNKNNHFILTGDFIHSCYEIDGSLEIIDSVKNHFEHEKNFHVLLGNHEWAQITNESVYKGGLNQTQDFQNIVYKKYQDRTDKKLESYKKFFKTLAIAVKTENKVLISHAGPSKHLKSEDDIKNISNDDYSKNLVLYEMLWNRNIECTRNYLDPFLKYLNCNASIVGHTPVVGVELHGNQLVVSSSFSMGKKAYMELDLEEEIHNGYDLLKMVKYLHSG